VISTVPVPHPSQACVGRGLIWCELGISSPLVLKHNVEGAAAGLNIRKNDDVLAVTKLRPYVSYTNDCISQKWGICNR